MKTHVERPSSSVHRLILSTAFAAICPFSGGAIAANALVRVDVVVATIGGAGPNVAIAGDIEARYRSNVSFRVGGKIASRAVDIGAHVSPDQILARIAPEQQLADLRNAEAVLASAQASLGQSKLTYERQEALLKDHYTTAPAYDQAVQAMKEAEAHVASAQAQIGSAQEKLAYTDLRAGVAGIVTARDAEVGQVVKEGNTVFTIAQDGPRDAVFTIYEALVAHPPEDRTIEVSLIADPTIKASATVREISPIVDAATGSVKVKATMGEAPAEMSLGAAVLGKGRLSTGTAVVLPWSALYRWHGTPAVWIYDPARRVVEPRAIAIASYAGRNLVLREGVAPGDRVVTTGIQFLTPGQAVEVASGDPR